MPHRLFERHQKTLQSALEAIRARTYWSAYPEVPSGKIYGETARDAGLAAFETRLKNRKFPIDQPNTGKFIGGEVSPFGMKLGVTYPQVDLDELLAAAQQAMEAWSKSDVETRAGIALEILDQLNKRSFEIANAVMHTTGQGFMMAFQAGGPHAQDRGLEAVAYAYQELSRIPATANWQKQVSKTDVIRLQKSYRIVPRGVAVVIGCSTFPTWNSYPGFFASLMIGSAVVVKPHPGAILPLAITVEVAREVLRDNGFDPNLVTLAADTHGKPITKKLVAHDEVKIIDYTGSSAFGEWIESHAPQAVVFTEKAGVNSVIIDSVDDLKAMAANLAFTLSLYSGQMCTTSQNIFIPRGGIDVGNEHKSFEDAAWAIVDEMNALLSDSKRAAEILGAIQNEETLKRIDEAANEAEEAATVLRPSQWVLNEQFPKARTRSPLVIKVAAGQKKLYMREMFGPISYIIATDDTPQSIELASKSAKELGAITWAAYSTNPQTTAAIEEAALEAAVPLSINLTGPIYVNQAAAFSDYHVSGCNPAGNATLTDSAFVTPRFKVMQVRTALPQQVDQAARSTEAAAAASA
ncbi:MAG: phenylacetic acid degradation protein PaaN [Phycisphaerales bacterium]|nr:phenylacetic acid degradation protein PaaN [Phycisphaerales bacterium]MCI0631896.1 phenylacetic acid degradation protein PaaN [Phycisphaerales bacterium]MCI0676751.1 phenylacetic acid degradation protein PaaN [Phycisphaerales bacterium]